MRATLPLFRFDPGWLFIAAGLAVCAAGAILPAQGDLEALQRQLTLLKQEEAQAYARLTAHADFLDAVDRAEPAIIRRLAAAQLNLVPEGDTPVLLAAANTSPVTDWIDATVQVDYRVPQATPVSTLSQLATGRHRLWMFGGGIMAVFVGLMLGPSVSRRGAHAAYARAYRAAADELTAATGLLDAIDAADDDAADQLSAELDGADSPCAVESPADDSVAEDDEALTLIDDDGTSGDAVVEMKPVRVDVEDEEECLQSDVAEEDDAAALASPLVVVEDSAIDEIDEADDERLDFQEPTTRTDDDLRASQDDDQANAEDCATFTDSIVENGSDDVGPSRDD